MATPGRAMNRAGAHRLRTRSVFLKVVCACLLGDLMFAPQAPASPASPGITAFAGSHIVVTVVSVDNGDQPIGVLSLAAQASPAVSSVPSLGGGWFQAVAIVYATDQWCVTTGTLAPSDMTTSGDGHDTTVRLSVDCMGGVEIKLSDSREPGILGSSDTGVDYIQNNGDAHSWEVQFGGTNFRGAAISGTAGGYPVTSLLLSTAGGWVADNAYGHTLVDLCILTQHCYPGTAQGAVTGWAVGSPLPAHRSAGETPHPNHLRREI